MNMKMILAAALSTTVAIVAFAGPGAGMASTNKGAKSKGGNAVKVGDPMFKSDMSKIAKPVSKGGAKGKGASARTYLHVDNQTAYNINIYLDGDYIGAVSAYGDAYAYEPDGSHELYAVSAGGTTTWGPRSASFGGGTYTWHLTD